AYTIAINSNCAFELSTISTCSAAYVELNVAHPPLIGRHSEILYSRLLKVTRSLALRSNTIATPHNNSVPHISKKNSMHPDTPSPPGASGAPGAYNINSSSGCTAVHWTSAEIKAALPDALGTTIPSGL